jgi:hypothetical protein
VSAVSAMFCGSDKGGSGRSPAYRPIILPPLLQAFMQLRPSTFRRRQLSLRTAHPPLCIILRNILPLPLLTLPFYVLEGTFFAIKIVVIRFQSFIKVPLQDLPADNKISFTNLEI